MKVKYVSKRLNKLFLIVATIMQIKKVAKIYHSHIESVFFFYTILSISCDGNNHISITIRRCHTI